MHAPLWYTMRTTITQQWCSILYVLTSCHCPHVDRNELLKTALAATNNDEQAAYLKGLRWVMLDVVLFDFDFYNNRANAQLFFSSF